MINLSLELWQKFALSALIFRVRLTCPAKPDPSTML